MMGVSHNCNSELNSELTAVCFSSFLVLFSFALHSQLQQSLTQIRSCSLQHFPCFPNSVCDTQRCSHSSKSRTLSLHVIECSQFLRDELNSDIRLQPLSIEVHCRRVVETIFEFDELIVESLSILCSTVDCRIDASFARTTAAT